MKHCQLKKSLDPTGRWGLGGVGDTASGVGVQAFLPAWVAGAGAAVAVDGERSELASTVVAALSTATTTAAVIHSSGGIDGCCQKWRL